VTPQQQAPATPGREAPTVLAVADTHALLWFATGQHNKLGRRAREHFERTDRREAAVYVPTFVLAEVGELVQRGRIRLPHPFGQWMDALIGSKVYIAADLSVDMIRCAHELFDIPERGDRLIAATAVSLALPLMTRDPQIAECAQVEQLWD
jgi:PIN domain nuclease of toxin-antitoxin system